MLINHLSIIFLNFRVLVPTEEKEVTGVKDFGCHCNHYPVAYLTVAASIGIKKSDIDVFIKRLHKTFVDSAKHEKSWSYLIGCIKFILNLWYFNIFAYFKTQIKPFS